MALPGYVHNIQDYLAASDFLLHPSILESSSVVIKEAGLVDLPVIVCRGVGDFDEYIVDGLNGFFVDRDNFVTQAVKIVERNAHQERTLENIGKKLHASILELFSIENVISQYEKLNKS